MMEVVCFLRLLYALATIVPGVYVLLTRLVLLYALATIVPGAYALAATVPPPLRLPVLWRLRDPILLSSFLLMTFMVGS